MRISMLSNIWDILKLPRTYNVVIDSFLCDFILLNIFLTFLCLRPLNTAMSLFRHFCSPPTTPG